MHRSILFALAAALVSMSPATAAIYEVVEPTENPEFFFDFDIFDESGGPIAWRLNSADAPSGVGIDYPLADYSHFWRNMTTFNRHTVTLIGIGDYPVSHQFLSISMTDEQFSTSTPEITLTNYNAGLYTIEVTSDFGVRTFSQSVRVVPEPSSAALTALACLVVTCRFRLSPRPG